MPGMDRILKKVILENGYILKKDNAVNQIGCLNVR